LTWAIQVLQEVAAARHILIRCGSTEIDGYAFCSGIRVLKPFKQRHRGLQALILPTMSLIRGAVFRRRLNRNEAGQPAKFSLNIRPLGELMDMYHTRKATDRLDKVYALIGMSSDDPDVAGLKADYNISWKDVMQKLVHFSLSDQISVSTWDDRGDVVVIEAKAYVLGDVSSSGEIATEDRRQSSDVTRYGRQHVEIAWKNVPRNFDEMRNSTSHIIVPATAKPIERGDVICLLRGASAPTIIRPRHGFSTVIMIAVPPTDGLPRWLASIATFPIDVLLVWDWDESLRKQEGEGDYQDMMSSRGCPNVLIRSASA